MKQLFQPDGIAVVGASSNPGKAGFVAIRNMREKGYPGKVYPVNPKETEILGYPCSPSLAEVEGHVDLVVLIMPSRMIYSVMDDLDRRMEEKGDVKFIVCAAADYAETKTPEGIDRQARLMRTAEKYGIRVVGPNCIGVIDNRSLVDTTFVDTGVPFSSFGQPSGITFISQSGALASTILMEGAGRVEPVLYNKFISIGNMADVDDLDRRMEEKGDVKFIVCAAADYAETKTPEGIDRQARLMRTAEKYGIRVVGPNCIGVIDNRSLVDTTFVDTGVPFSSFGQPSGITFISQSGALASTILMEGAGRVEPVLYNKFISIGNMADVDFVDLLNYFETDDSTRVIGIYMEGCGNGRELAETLKRVSRKKPIVVLKVGRSALGGAAANSHTGSMAGSDAVYDAMFKQTGVVRVDTIDELIDTLQAFDRLPLPGGGNLFLYSQAGGPGIYCTDAIARWPQLKMPLVSDDTKARLAATQQPMANICHPEGYADITASASVRNHVDGLQIVLQDENVDAVVFITVVPTFLPQEELARELVKMTETTPQAQEKPVFYCVMAGAYTSPARRIMEQAGLCTFDAPDKAVLAAKNMCNYAAFRRRQKED